MTYTLSKINKHERDEFITFEEKEHKYQILSDIETKYTSVTTWIHTLFPPFNSTIIIRNMMKGKNWNPENKYWGMTEEEIKSMWSKNSQSVAGEGTRMHYFIECFMNNINIDYPYTHQDLYNNYIVKGLENNDKYVDVKLDENIEWGYFLNFIKDFPNLKPYRTEWTIYHDDVKISGSVDMVYDNGDGTLSIYDWKRSKEIVTDNKYKKFSNNKIISHIPDTNYWHYAIQLNTYKKILEDKYGKTIRDLYLVRLHPNDVNYELIEVPILEDYIVKLFQEIMEKRQIQT